MDARPPSPASSTRERDCHADLRGHPDVSVVIPARNEEAYVCGALASVVAQSWPAGQLEAIVVDNGSSDRTAELVREFAAETPWLAVRLVTEPVPGLARTKNRGASVARGEWLVFLDADSRLRPDLVAQLVERARRGYPAGSIAVLADSGDWLERGFFALMEVGKRWFGVRAQMFYCSRALFERFGGFDERLRLAEDSEFLGRLQRARLPVCHLAESSIGTSPRRLRGRPFHLAIVTTFARWALAHAGVGRRWQY
ncbi:MAG: glycosyltransferase [Chloroflexi bacterium]|nr:glycosyltransferase [Chloroflexota bacterium]